jgi:hypothetical protein
MLLPKASNARNPCADPNFLFFITEIQGQGTNRHEAELNYTTVPKKIRNFDEYKKDICYFVKSKFFL